MNVLINNAPDSIDQIIGDLGLYLSDTARLFDLVLSFHLDSKSLAESLIYKDRIDKAGMIWIAWPKKSSGVSTDINRDKIRDCYLNNGLVDVKIASLDVVWSALKFVYRIKDR